MKVRGSVAETRDGIGSGVRQNKAVGAVHRCTTCLIKIQCKVTHCLLSTAGYSYVSQPVAWNLTSGNYISLLWCKFVNYQGYRTAVAEIDFPGVSAPKK